MPSNPPLTVVMPAFNEEGSLEAAIAEARREVLDRVPGSGLLVVDDGSVDATPRLLDRAADDDPRIEVVHQANAGHGPALRRGMDHARGEWLLLLDSDAQISLDTFPAHWRQATSEGVAVLGVRRNRRDRWPRRVLSRSVRAAIRVLFHVRVRDANAPYKLLRRADWQRALRVIPPDTLAPSLFLALFLAHSGVRRIEVPVTHRPRAAGIPTLRWGRLLRFCARGFLQMLAFRRRLVS